MVPRSLFVLFVLSVSVAYGQLDSNTITVTANRNATLQPDQVVFSVSVTSGLSTSLDDVLAALAGSGITSANFAGVGSGLVGVIFDPLLTNGTLPPPTIVWNFTLPAPFANMKATVTSLTALQQSIAKNNSGLTLSFTVQGTQVSSQLQQMQTCSVTGLLSDARAQAQALATAANLFLGAVVAMSGMTSSNCTLTVEFAVTR